VASLPAPTLAAMAVEAERAPCAKQSAARPGPAGGGARRRPLRSLLRFIAAVMAVSGTLLIADAAITLLWQEPISALLAGRQQAALAGELPPPVPAGPGRPSAADLRRMATEHERATGRGDAWGRIELPSPARDFVVVEGTDGASLRKGPGHYPDTPAPGEGGTVAIAGHRTTYLAPFRTLDRLEPGDEVAIEMPWGRFTYAVEKTEIVAPTDTEVIDRVDHERLVLTACHPLYSAAERIVVSAALEDVERVSLPD